MQFIPLVEFAFDTPRGEKTAATINPNTAAGSPRCMSSNRE
jgi:hypothetical protein